MSRWLLIVLGVWGATPVHAEVIFKVHHFLPATSTVQKQLLEPWCDRIQTASQGRMRCRIFPAMQLGGGPAQLFDQVRDGVVEIAWTLPGYTAGRFPRAEVFELPFIATTAKATSQALNHFAKQHLTEEFGEIHPLLFHVHAPGAFHLRRPARGQRDLNGLRLRGPTRLSTQMLAAFGATPINMPANQVPEALTRGVIEGALLPFEVTRSLRILELAPNHLTVDGIYTAVFLFAMHKPTYDGLAPELRAIIDAHSGLKLAEEIGQVWDEIEEIGKQEALKRGNPLIALETQGFVESSQIVVEQWQTEMAQRGIDGEALLEEARRLVQQFTVD